MSINWLRPLLEYKELGAKFSESPSISTMSGMWNKDDKERIVDILLDRNNIIAYSWDDFRKDVFTSNELPADGTIFANELGLFWLDELPLYIALHDVVLPEDIVAQLLALYDDDEDVRKRNWFNWRAMLERFSKGEELVVSANELDMETVVTKVSHHGKSLTVISLQPKDIM